MKKIIEISKDFHLSIQTINEQASFPNENTYIGLGFLKQTNLWNKNVLFRFFFLLSLLFFPYWDTFSIWIFSKCLSLPIPHFEQASALFPARDLILQQLQQREVAEKRQCSPRDGLALKCLFCFPDVLFLQETGLPLMEETVSVKCVLNQWYPVQKNSPLPAVSIVSFLSTPMSGGLYFYFLLLPYSNVQC